MISNKKIEQGIVAFDPGKVTGIALRHKGKLESYEVGRDKIWCALKGLIIPGMTVVYESYISWPQSASFTRQTDALRIIGAIEFLAYENNNQIKHQRSSQAMFTFDASKLKQKGLFNAGKKDANAAMAHLCYYMYMNHI